MDISYERSKLEGPRRSKLTAKNVGQHFEDSCVLGNVEVNIVYRTSTFMLLL